MDLRKILNRISDRQKTLLLKVDRNIALLMGRTGLRLEYYALGAMFIWFGLLKISGYKSASSIIAKSVYWFSPDVMVPVLGLWELVIGLFLIAPIYHRIAVFLLLVRFPGTVLALIIHSSTCFDGSLLVPTIQGQYLIKDLTLIGAALAIGGHSKNW